MTGVLEARPQEGALDRWFVRQAAREARIVLLEEALLGGRTWAYAWYRLRFFLASYLVESAAHAVLAVVALRTLGASEIDLVIAAHGAVLLVSYFWWGALEALRAQVRDLHRSARPHRIPGVVAAWLGLAVLLSAVVGVLGLGWLGWAAVTGRFGVGEAYVAAVALRVVLDLPVRALHSGVYAMRRVYKPLAATLAPELAGLAVLLSLAPAVGAPAVVVAALVTTALSTALTLRYTGKVYAFLGIPVRPAFGTVALRGCLREWREALPAGAAQAMTGVDALVVLALLAGTQADAPVLLFLVLPSVTAGAEWARLLYFDLKRLELDLFANLRRRFSHVAARLAVVLGVAFGAVALAVTAGFRAVSGDPASLAAPGAALAAFFVARSLLALAQVRAFAERAYAAVTAAGAGCLAGLVGVAVLAGTDVARIGGIALVTAVTAAVLHRAWGVRERRGPTGALLTLDWLRRLGQVRDEVRIGSATVTAATGLERLDARSRADAGRWRLTQLADRMARRLGPDGAAAWIGPDRVVWFERAGGPPRIDAGWLARAGGGLVRQVRAQTRPDGEQAMLAAANASLLGRPGGHLRTAILPVDPVAARRAFHALVPAGHVLDLARNPPPAIAELPGRELRAVLADASAFARDLRVRRPRARFDVTPLCAGGELELVFLIDREDRPDRRRGRALARWQHHVTELNLRAAVAGTRRVAHPERLEAA